MRRKAQAMPIPTENTQMSGDALLNDLLQLLGGGVSPEVLNPHQALPPEPSLGDVASTEMEGAIQIAPVMPEHAAGEAMEATAFNKLQCGLECLERGLELFKQYEEMDLTEETGSDESKAIKKIDGLVEDMREVFEELCKAEIEEHEEMAAEAKKDVDVEVEIEIEKDDDEDDEDEEKKEASLRGFVRTASRRQVNASNSQIIVPLNMEF